MSRKISLDRLDTFRRIARAGSIAEAAGRDPNRQSQFSRQVKELEEALEKPLLLRRGRRIEGLTPAGRELALLTEKFLGSVDALRGEGRLESYLIGAGESLLDGILLPRFAKIHLAHPDVSFRFESADTTTLLEGLRSGRMDLALVRGQPAGTGWHALEVGRMNYCCVVPRGLQVPTPPESMQEFLRYPLAMLLGKGRFARWIERLAETDEPPNIYAYAQTFHQVAQLIRGGGICGILPEWYAAGLDSIDFWTGTFDELDALSDPVFLVYYQRASEMRGGIQRLAERIAVLLDR